MDRVQIDVAARDGIMLSGFEPHGEKYRYQEWWLIYEQT